MYRFEKTAFLYFFRKSLRLFSDDILTPADFDAIAKEISAHPLTAEKVGLIAAHRAEIAERIDTRSEGHETTNVAQPGDWIATNLGTNARPVVDSKGQLNTYVIPAGKFGSLYEATDIASDLGPVFKAKGRVTAYELPGSFDIVAPWKERQKGQRGYLVRNGDEVYCIEKTVFHSTYDFLGPGALRLLARGEKRILSLDGGGVKGMLTLGFLSRLEEVLKEQHGDPGLVLADYFDMIGGTSVGAILATQLALGAKVSEVKDLFTEWCPSIFRRPPLWLYPISRIPFVGPRFDARYLEQKLDAKLGDMRLGSPKLRTGLCIVTKRVDTGSPWVLTNNPRSKYWHARGDAVVANKEYRLADVVRASAAAPIYFKPHAIRISTDKAAPPGLFVDGAVSPYNNPSLQLLMVAGIGGYGLDWELGEDKLLLVSVGTGSYRARSVGGGLLVRQAAEALIGVVGDCEALGLTLLQWMSASRNPWKINSEIGDLSENFLGQAQGLAKPLLRFERYDAPLELAWLKEQLGIVLDPAKLDSLRDFTDPRNIDELFEIGRRAAEKQIKPEHFPAAFKVATAAA